MPLLLSHYPFIIARSLFLLLVLQRNILSNWTELNWTIMEDKEKYIFFYEKTVLETSSILLLLHFIIYFRFIAVMARNRIWIEPYIINFESIFLWTWVTCIWWYRPPLLSERVRDVVNMLGRNIQTSRCCFRLILLESLVCVCGRSNTMPYSVHVWKNWENKTLLLSGVYLVNF